MAKKALGRDLGDLLSRARPARFLDHAVPAPPPAGGKTAPAPPDPVRFDPAGAPWTGPSDPPAPVTPPAAPHLERPPSPSPGPDAIPAPAPVSAAPEPLRTRPPPPWQRPPDPSFTAIRPLPPAQAESRRAWWIAALVLDLVLLGTAAWLCLASPLAKPWAYGLAVVCIGAGALAACAVPLLPPSTTQLQGPPQRVRPDPARIRVQLTRL